MAKIWPVGILVTSDLISHIGYRPESEQLLVIFKARQNDPRGSAYIYEGVPEHLAQELLDADSHGSFLLKNIVGDRKNPPYVFNKLQVDQAATEPLESEIFHKVVSIEACNTLLQLSLENALINGTAPAPVKPIKSKKRIDISNRDLETRHLAWAW